MSDLAIFFDVLFDVITLNFDAINKQDWELFQGYGFFFLIAFLVITLYSYWIHLFRAEKKGKRNYEKYANLALDDELNDKILEKRS